MNDLFRSLSALCLLLVVSCHTFTASAESHYRLVTGYLPPWSMSTIVDYPGMFVEIMREVDYRLGYKTKIEIYPWGRAQNIAQKEDNVILFPIARMPVREDKYSWIVKVKPMRMVFVSPLVHIKNEKQAKSLPKLMVHKNAPPEFFLQARGFSNLVGIHDVTPQIPYMLNRQRAQAWFTPQDMAEWIWKLNPELALPHISPPLSQHDLYIVGSKGLPKELKDSIKHIVEDMRADGTLEALIQRYKR